MTSDRPDPHGSTRTLPRSGTAQAAPGTPGDTGRLLGAGSFARRARLVRRSARRWRLATAVVLVLAVAAAWLVWWSPLLVVRTVRVEGATGAVADQVRAAARLPGGEHLAGLDVEDISRQVATVAAVRDVVVSRSWPSTVVIRVQQRVAVAVVRDSSGGLHLADATGDAFAAVASAPDGLPVVTAPASDPAAVQAVVAVLGAIPAGLRAQVSSAGADSPDSVQLRLGHLTVVWGSASDSVLKAQVLQALRHHEPKATRIDVSAPDRAAVG